MCLSKDIFFLMCSTKGHLLLVSRTKFCRGISTVRKAGVPRSFHIVNPCWSDGVARHASKVANVLPQTLDDGKNIEVILKVIS
jgi:hypothetical protein